jgi:CO/xanthine dehydrogenase FAD-binding subunit
MRAYLPAYELKSPADLAETLDLMQRDPGAWRPFAGGTDLMVLLEAGKLPHRRFLNLWRLAELRGIAETSEYVVLGAMTVYTQVRRSPVLHREFPLLCRAASETGGIATQNRGTLGGNVANASPAADSPPALLVYDAELELVSARGARWVPYRDFHIGYKAMLLEPDELIRRIRLPRPARNWRQFYRKVGTRKAQAISKICFAGRALLEGEVLHDVRIALGSVAPTVVRCSQTEALLRGEKPHAELLRAAQEQLAREIAPIDDLRSSARYRLRVAQNLLAGFLGYLREGTAPANAESRA